MKKQKIIIAAVLVVLAVGGYVGVRYIALQRQLHQAQAALEAQRTNDKVLAFIKLFIEEVLKAKTDVSFEVRLKLEAMVRNLEDEEILARWQAFVDSKTEADAQTGVKNLLETLINKIKAP